MIDLTERLNAIQTPDLNDKYSLSLWNENISALKNCTNLTIINVPWSEGAVANAPWVLPMLRLIITILLKKMYLNEYCYTL